MPVCNYNDDPLNLSLFLSLFSSPELNSAWFDLIGQNLVKKSRLIFSGVKAYEKLLRTCSSL